MNRSVASTAVFETVLYVDLFSECFIFSFLKTKANNSKVFPKT